MRRGDQGGPHEGGGVNDKAHGEDWEREFQTKGTAAVRT